MEGLGDGWLDSRLNAWMEGWMEGWTAEWVSDGATVDCWEREKWKLVVEKGLEGEKVRGKGWKGGNQSHGDCMHNPVFLVNTPTITHILSCWLTIDSSKWLQGESDFWQTQRPSLHGWEDGERKLVKRRVIGKWSNIDEAMRREGYEGKRENDRGRNSDKGGEMDGMQSCVDQADTD